MDIEQIDEINKQLVKAIKDEIDCMVDFAEKDTNSKLGLQSKLTDLLRVLRIENGKQ